MTSKDGLDRKYDLLNNQIQADQGSQTRPAVFDALSRLTAETKPESGATSYFYTTAGGALCSGNPQALCRRTDARGITITFTYDAEDRLTGKSFSNADSNALTRSIKGFQDLSNFSSEEPKRLFKKAIGCLFYHI